MFSALLYLLLTSWKNRLVMRFKRLKQPKYLIGAIVGGLYFYFYFFQFLFRRQIQHGVVAQPFYQSDPALSLSIGAIIVAVMVVVAWVVPRKRAALTFTEAEIAFLFPAPVTRQTLIHFKLLKSQLSILIMSLIFTLIFRRTGGHVWIRVVGWWLVLMTLNLHYIGASFAVTTLMDRGITTWKRRLAILGLLLAVAAGLAVWTVRALPPLTGADLNNPMAMLDYAKELLVSGPLPYLLSPFLLLVRPYQAAHGVEFLHAVWPALLLLAVHYWWVMRSDVAFEEASLEASQKLAERVAHVRAGKSAATAGLKLKGRRPPFNLAPAGNALVALLWKNLLSAGQGFSKRVWFILIWLTVAMVFAMRGLVGASANWLPVAGGAVAMIGSWLVLFGPQLVRQDLRQDIPLADLLKLYPMRGWQVVLGEILAPAVILTGMEWLLLILAVGFLIPAKGVAMAPGLVYAIGLGAAVVLPALNLISLLIPNAAVLLFPSWFQSGKDAPQGIEATGQRLIFAIGQFLAFAVSLVPAAVVFAVLFFLIKFATGGMLLAIPAASAAATVVLLVEAWFGILWLGWAFERFDVSSEQAG